MGLFSRSSRGRSAPAEVKTTTSHQFFGTVNTHVEHLVDLLIRSADATRPQQLVEKHAYIARPVLIHPDGVESKLQLDPQSAMLEPEMVTFVVDLPRYPGALRLHVRLIRPLPLDPKAWRKRPISPTFEFRACSTHCDSFIQRTFREHEDGTRIVFRCCCSSKQLECQERLTLGGLRTSFWREEGGAGEFMSLASRRVRVAVVESVGLMEE